MVGFCRFITEVESVRIQTPIPGALDDLATSDRGSYAQDIQGKSYDTTDLTLGRVLRKIGENVASVS